MQHHDATQRVVNMQFVLLLSHGGVILITGALLVQDPVTGINVSSRCACLHTAVCFTVYSYVASIRSTPEAQCESWCLGAGFNALTTWYDCCKHIPGWTC